MKKILSALVIFLAACVSSDAGSGIFYSNGATDVNATLILPFNASSGKADTKYMDFYAGALLAIKDLNEKGINVALSVVDCAVENQDDNELYDKIANSDFVIGPVSCDDQKKIEEACRVFGVPMISPMDHKSECYLPMNDSFIQIPASYETQVENLISSLNGAQSGPVTVFCNNKSKNDARMLSLVETVLDRNSIPYVKKTYEVQQGRTIVGSMMATMRVPEGQVNKVIIASEDVAFASDVVRNMALLVKNGIPVSVYGSTKLRNFNTIDSELLYTVNFHTSTPYYVDYENEETIRFIKAFREYFRVEPTPYSFQGYDLLTYFSLMRREMGNSMLEFIQYYPMDLLQNSLHLQKSGEENEFSEGGGFNNKATRNIEYAGKGRILLN